MGVKEIASLIPAMQSLALVSENVKQAQKKKQTTKDMLKLGTKNIVGVSLIKINADLIGGLD